MPYTPRTSVLHHWPEEHRRWLKLQGQIQDLLSLQQPSPQNPLFYHEGYAQLESIAQTSSLAHQKLSADLMSAKPQTACRENNEGPCTWLKA